MTAIQTPARMQDDQDDSLFRQSLRDDLGEVRRVYSDRVEQWREKPRPRRRPPEPDTRPPPPSAYPPEDAREEDYHFRRAGIQDKVFRRLRRGEFGGRALDLHGMTRAAAFAALTRCIAEARRDGERAVRVIHGKGYGSQHGRAVLKPSVAAWLKGMPEVLAFCPAQPAHGGGGALYVLLKRA